MKITRDGSNRYVIEFVYPNTSNLTDMMFQTYLEGVIQMENRFKNRKTPQEAAKELLLEEDPYVSNKD